MDSRVVSRQQDSEELMAEEMPDAVPLVAGPAKPGRSRRAVLVSLLLGAVAAVAIAHKIVIHPPAPPVENSGTIYTGSDEMTKFSPWDTTKLDSECSTSGGCACGSGSNVLVCPAGDTCCTRKDNGAGMCLKKGAYCCHGTYGVIGCQSEENCCTNDAGAAYCCTGSLKCGSNVCYTDECFPGEAKVQLQGRGHVSMDSLRVGDTVLVEKKGAGLVYEPVLGFLHAMPESHSEFVKVVHTNGEFRATAKHMVFVEGLAGREDKPVGTLRAGEKVFFTADGTGAAVSSVVLKLERGLANSGMYGPLTASGTIVVDDVVASIYATPNLRFLFSHASAHALLFPLRAYHALGLSSLLAGGVSATAPAVADEMHPYVAFLLKKVRLFKDV